MEAQLVVTLVVAILGLISTLCAALGGQLIAARYAERRERVSRLEGARLEVYTSFLSNLDELTNGAPDRPGLLRDLNRSLMQVRMLAARPSLHAVVDDMVEAVRDVDDERIDELTRSFVFYARAELGTETLIPRYALALWVKEQLAEPTPNPILSPFKYWQRMRTEKAVRRNGLLDALEDTETSSPAAGADPSVAMNQSPNASQTAPSGSGADGPDPLRRSQSQSQTARD